MTPTEIGDDRGRDAPDNQVAGVMRDRGKIRFRPKLKGGTVGKNRVQGRQNWCEAEGAERQRRRPQISMEPRLGMGGNQGSRDGRQQMKG